MYTLSVSLAGPKAVSRQNVGRLLIMGGTYPQDGQLLRGIHTNRTGPVAPSLLGSTSLALDMRIKQADP
jgi:hypothetical protein